MARPNKRGQKNNKTPKQFEERLLEVRKVTRVTTGGRQMAFRATMLIGDKKGKIGIGVAKGNDFGIAVTKATHEAYKNIVTVPIAENATVPYMVELKNKASRIRLIPASVGTGLKAGSSLRIVLELAGYENILSKIIGSNNKLNVALTTIKALSEYKHADHFSIHNKKKADDKDTGAGGTDTKKTATKKTATKKTATKKTDTKKTDTKKTATKADKTVEKTNTKSSSKKSADKDKA